MSTRTKKVPPTKTTKRGPTPAQKGAFTKFVKQVEQSNKTFAKASREQKIVMVAKDVLQMLDLGRIKARHGEYFSVNRGKAATYRQVQASTLLKLPELPACNVCAIGGAMVAATLRLNKAMLQDGEPAYWPGDPHMSRVYVGYYDNSADDMAARANEVFGTTMLRMMEEAFEYGDFGYGAARRGTVRLRAIYENIVKNGGTLTEYKRT